MSKLISFAKRLIHTAMAVRKCYRDGGVTMVNVAQINHGEILKGKSVLITGGSRGIGLAIAKKCLSEGATVVITGRSIKKLEIVASNLNNPSLEILEWNVGDVSHVNIKLEEALTLAGGRLDILVNNAGVLSTVPFTQVTEKVWEEVYSVNSKGLFFLTQALTNRWIKNSASGKVINISSSGGFLVAPYPYRMTKWDLVGLTAGLGKTLSPHGIIVNGIAPGRTATGMLNKNATENVYDSLVPVERFGLPEEIAELAVFLMSDAANYIIGQTIICDGGYTLRI